MSDPSEGDLAYESPVKLFRVDRFNAKPRPLKTILAGMIPRGALVGLIGPPGSMKTLFAADIGACMATGTTWFGREVRKGPVFFLTGESPALLLRRFPALERARGISVAAAPLYVSNRLDNLVRKEAAAALGDKLAKRCDKIGTAPSLIVVDTLSKAMLAGDENSASDMNRLIANVSDHLRDRLRCAVLLIHHSGHTGTRARGSSAYKGALDTEMTASREDMQVKIACTKQRDMAEFDPIELTARLFRMGPDDVRIAFAEARSASSSSKQELAVAMLESMGAARGGAVESAEWRRALIDGGILQSEKGFERLKARLKAKRQIVVEGKLVRPSSESA